MTDSNLTFGIAFAANGSRISHPGTSGKIRRSARRDVSFATAAISSISSGRRWMRLTGRSRIGILELLRIAWYITKRPTIVERTGMESEENGSEGHPLRDQNSGDSGG